MEEARAFCIESEDFFELAKECIREIEELRARPPRKAWLFGFWDKRSTKSPAGTQKSQAH